MMTIIVCPGENAFRRRAPSRKRRSSPDLDRAPDDRLGRAVEGVVHQGDATVAAVAFLAAEGQGARVAAVAVEIAEIAREEAGLPFALRAGRHHEHVVAERFSKGVDADGHAA